MRTAPSYLWSRWLYLRLLAVGFLTGFLSLATQIHGLIGPRGILPARDYLAAVAHAVPVWQRLLIAPSLLWLDAGDTSLTLLCSVGAVAALLLLCNRWPRPSLLVCWLLYLSFVCVARDFSSFQSDGLMLESAWLGLLLAPRGARPGLGQASPPSRFTLLLCWWLLFRLMFESGLGKLLSGDVAWRTCTALDDYYVNCPFPTWIGWYVQHLPHAFHAACVGATLWTEVVCPPLIWLGRRWRLLAGVSWVFLQGGILLTGNYTYLNYNAIALSLLLLDDGAVGHLLGRRAWPLAWPGHAPRWRRVGAGIMGGANGYISTLLLLQVLHVPVRQLPAPLTWPVAAAEEFRSANRYGLFAVMTHARDQIEFEGSSDGGRTWQAYRFRWQPQALDVAPRFMAPHLPRFDWNLWFATLETWRQHPWVLETAGRLIEGEPEVTALFARNPFPDRPPQMIRLPLYRYEFTTLSTHRATGRYWRRRRLGYYAPSVVRDPVSGRLTLQRPSTEDPLSSGAGAP